MKKSLEQAIPELLAAGILDEETAAQIRAYYAKQPGRSVNWLYVIFGILGALLVGLGFILIVAHNWDQFPRMVKTGFALLPLLVGYAAGVYVIRRRLDEPAWREGAATYITLALGGCLGLVSQIYHIEGSLSAFLLTWLILAWPLMWVMRSGMASLLYWIGAAWMVMQGGYFEGWDDGSETHLYYWMLLAGGLPFYLQLAARQPDSLFARYHHWVLPLSVTIALGTLTDGQGAWMMPAYLNLFGAFLLLGRSAFMAGYSGIANGYAVLGALGGLFILYWLSFHWYWDNFQQYPLAWSGREWLLAMGLLGAVAALAWWKNPGLSLAEIDPLDGAVLGANLLFFIGQAAPMVAVVGINLLLLALGLLLLRRGAQQTHLGYLNAGLLTICLLITLRFFDVDMSFVARGMLFVAMGLAFFFANYRMIQKRQKND